MSTNETTDFDLWRAQVDHCLAPTQPPSTDDEAQRFYAEDYGAGSSALLIAEERRDRRKSMPRSDTTAAIARLVRWRDVGDGPTYCAGGTQFGHDVKAALAEIERLTAALTEVVNATDVGAYFTARRAAGLAIDD